jgi:hypothetical protein
MGKKLFCWDDNGRTGPHFVAVQNRNDVALERHRLRMEKIRQNREKKVQNGAGSMGSM